MKFWFLMISRLVMFSPGHPLNSKLLHFLADTYDMYY
jgi:hypothetical protein